MSNKISIEAKLTHATHSVVTIRAGGANASDRGPSVPLDRLPEELVWFIHRYEQVEVYTKHLPHPRNGWRLGDLSWWPRYTVNQERDADPVQYPYFEDVWQIACYEFDGGEQIAVDLHPGARFGNICWVTQTDIDYGGGAIVIAESFFEWLERTLDHGPNVKLPYWREKGFKDYGSAIPNDPYYKPPMP